MLPTIGRSTKKSGKKTSKKTRSQGKKKTTAKAKTKTRTKAKTGTKAKTKTRTKAKTATKPSKPEKPARRKGAAQTPPARKAPSKDPSKDRVARMAKARGELSLSMLVPSVFQVKGPRSGKAKNASILALLDSVREQMEAVDLALLAEQGMIASDLGIIQVVDGAPVFSPSKKLMASARKFADK